MELITLEQSQKDIELYMLTFRMILSRSWRWRTTQDCKMLNSLDTGFVWHPTVWDKAIL